MHIYTERYTSSSFCRIVSRLPLNFRAALTLIICGAFASPVFAQNCNFNVNLVSVIYVDGYTTFKWSVQNTNPGDGSNGTTQDLSHWGFFLNPCIDKGKIVAGESSYGPDNSQTCTGTSDIVKFDRGTSGTTLSYYQIKLSGFYVAGTATAYFKFGTECCTKQIQGIGVPPPQVVSCPANQVIECPAVPNFSTPTFSSTYDNSLEISYVDVRENLTCGYKVTRTWTAKDDCGGIATCAQAITVTDKTAPVINGVAGPLSIECSATPVFSTPTVNDACDPNATLTYKDVKTTLSCGYSITRTWTAKDACGNTATKSQTITFKDETAPVINGVGGPLTGECSSVPAFSAPKAADACDANPSLTFADVKTPNSCGYSLTRTWTAKDACGNTATASQVITVQDKTPPVFSGVGASKAIECPATPVFSTPVITDACDANPALSFTDVKTPLSCGGYAITRTWTAKDACGNTSTASQKITVQDKKGPVINGVGSSMTLECPASPVFSTATVTDACDANPTLTYNDVKTDLPCGGYSITRTWTAKDVCGNVTVKSQKITVQDKKGPTITGVGSSKTIECPATPVFSTPTVTDACDANPTLTFSDVKTNLPCGGYSITRTWTAKDVCGNVTVKSQKITVQDKKGPALTGVGSSKTIECPATPVFSTPTATDACDANPTLTFTDVKTTSACGYTVTRIWKATDVCGNTTSASQKITVQDTKAPVISGVGGSSTVDCSATPPFSSPTVSDGCDASPVLTYNDVTTQSGCSYIITRTWTAKDACGNTATASQTITVQDKTAPVISGVAGPSTIDCSATPVFSTPTVSDVCDPNATLSYTDVNTVLSCGYSITRTWTAKDACGNTATASQTITVQDKTAPTIKCAVNKTISCGAQVVFDQPTATDACDSDPLIKVVSDVIVENTHTRTWIAIDDCGNKSASCSQTITVENCPHIFPTQTTCCNYVTKTVSPLLQVCYTQSGGSVTNAIPGVFFYYSSIVAPSANFVINVDQTNNLSGFKLFNVQNLENIRLTDANCANSISFTATIVNGSQVVYNVKGATPGATYIISIKYESKSIIGSSFTSTTPPDVTYSFKSYVTPEGGSRRLVPGSIGSLQAKDNCSDNTPLPGSCSQPSYTTRTAAPNNNSNKPSTLSVFAYPNPYVNEVRFAIQSPVSGKGSLDIYNTLGQKLKTVYQGHITEGKILTVSYKVPSAQQANLMYVLHVGGHKVSGMVMKF